MFWVTLTGYIFLCPCWSILSWPWQEAYFSASYTVLSMTVLSSLLSILEADRTSLLKEFNATTNSCKVFRCWSAKDGAVEPQRGTRLLSGARFKQRAGAFWAVKASVPAGIIGTPSPKDTKQDTDRPFLGYLGVVMVNLRTAWNAQVPVLLTPWGAVPWNAEHSSPLQGWTFPLLRL